MTLPKNHGKLWTVKDDQVLMRLHNDKFETDEIADSLDRTEASIVSRLELLKQRKTANTFITSNNTKQIDMDTNLVHLITLLQKNYTTCKVRFEGTNKGYTYKMAKDSGIEVGDFVVVDANDQLSAGVVLEVHDEAQIDFKAPYAYKWIVQKIDMTAYKEQVRKETEVIAMLKVEQRRQEQEDALNKLLGTNVNREELMRLLNA
jgi:hypothetical protein